jgi:hypothetical protein
VLALVDVENYIDYLLCHAFADAGADWPNNYRLARDRDGGKFRFFVWDAELAFQPGYYIYDATGPGSIGYPNGITKLHTLLRSYEGYREAFSERIKHHFFVTADPDSGSLAIVGGVDRAVALFEEEMARFLPLLHCESARWGSLAKEVPYTESDPDFLPEWSVMGDWERTTDHIVGEWLPLRRQIFLDDMQAAGLYIP